MININRIKLRESVFILSIFTLILEYQTTLVHTFFVDRIIKIVAILVLVLLSKNGRENLNNVYIQRTSKMYLILSLLMVVSTLFNLSVLGVVYLFKYYTVLVIAFLLLLQVNPQYFSDRIIKFPILIGAAFSVISIIFWIIVYFGFEPQFIFVSSERVARLSSYSYLWGDMSYIGIPGGFSRACSFFWTPNSYGNFLIFPAFVSFGYFKLKNRLVYLLISVLCFSTIFLTFALTILLASIAAISLSTIFLFGSKINVVKKSPFMSGIIGSLLALMILIGVMQYYSIKNMESQSLVFRGGSYGTIFYFFNVSTSDIVPDINKPFGHGLAYQRDGKDYTAQFGFVRWIVLLGYPGLIFFLVFIIYMFKIHVFPALMHKQRQIEYYVALVFVAQTICEIQEGSWISPPYLFTTAMLILLKKYEFKEWKSFRHNLPVPLNSPLES